MIVTFGGYKGGSGKSTLATNIAAHLSQEGTRFVLMDTDKQKTANKWAARRNKLREVEPSIPLVRCIDKTGDDVDHSARIFEQDYGIVLIDAAGRDSDELRLAISASDLVVVPVSPSQFELETLHNIHAVIAMVKRAANPNVNALIVINGVDHARGQREYMEARETVMQFAKDTFFIVSNNHLSYLKSYKTAGKEGRGVVEMKNATAKAEVQLLAQEIFE